MTRWRKLIYSALSSKLVRSPELHIWTKAQSQQKGRFKMGEEGVIKGGEPPKKKAKKKAAAKKAAPKKAAKKKAAKKK